MGYIFTVFFLFVLCLHKFHGIILSSLIYLGGITLFKVLVADTNEKINSSYCKLVANDNRFEIFNTYYGKETLDRYYETKPDIFVLDSNFSDINSFDILRRLSISLEEKEKCNTLFIANKFESQMITDVSKIYEIIYKPCQPEDVFNSICKMYKEKYYPIENLDDIYSYFSDFKMHLSINGCEYMKSAIELCLRHYPFYGNSLDDLLEKLADKYNKTPEQIRDGLKSALKPINISSQDYSRKLYPEIFKDDDLLSPRKFIERSTIYFHKKQKRNQ